MIVIVYIAYTIGAVMFYVFIKPQNYMSDLHNLIQGKYDGNSFKNNLLLNHGFTVTTLLPVYWEIL